MRSLRLYHKTLIVQHIVTIAAIIFFCIGSFFIGKKVMATLDGVNTATADLHTTFEVVNRPRTGTLAGLNQVIFGVDALVKKANGVLDHEQKQLSTLDTQEATLFNDLHKIAVNANDNLTTFKTTNETLNTLLGNVNKSAEKVPTLVDNLSTITGDADKKINDPAVQKIINNLGETSTQVVGITTNVNGITDNVNKVTTHLEKTIDAPPTLKQKIEGAFNLLWKIGMLVK